MSVVHSPEPIVPYGADQTIFVVVENEGVSRVVECSYLEAVVTDMLAGKFRDPVRIATFNTLGFVSGCRARNRSTMRH